MKAALIESETIARHVVTKIFLRSMAGSEGTVGPLVVATSIITFIQVIFVEAICNEQKTEIR